LQETNQFESHAMKSKNKRYICSIVPSTRVFITATINENKKQAADQNWTWQV